MAGGRAQPRQVLGWCLYDFANSAFSLIVVTYAFNPFFRDVVAEDPARADTLWGIATAISMIATAFLSPWLGAVADLCGARLRILRWLTLLCAAATSTLYFLGPGDEVAAVALFALANASLATAVPLCNAFLTEIAPEDRRGRVSALGWGLGYAGQLLALLLMRPLMAGLDSPERVAAFRWVFPLTAAWLVAFSLPTFLWLREAPRAAGADPGAAPWRLGWRRVAQTLRDIRRYRVLCLFLVAYFLFIDGIDTMFTFASSVAQRSYGFTLDELGILFLAASAVAAVGTVLLGPLSERGGGKRPVAAALLVVLAALALVGLGNDRRVFWGAALLLAPLLGFIQASCRSLLTRIVPPGRQAEFFGFFALTGKCATTIGPPLFGWVSDATGSQRFAVSILVLLVGTGLLLLLRVSVEAGERAARDAAV